MSLISIIIPYYKKKSYIQQTLKSVLTQNYKNFEVLIIYDDNDKTELKKLRDFEKKDKRIKIIVNKKNIGAGLSRNRGIAASRGKFIAFIDADDLWKKDKLSKQIKYMKKFKIDVCHTSYHIINSENIKIGYRDAKKLDYHDLVKSCDIGLSTVIIKKKLLKNDLFANLKTKEDYILWLKLSKKRYVFYSIKTPLTLWRKSKDSLSSSILTKLFNGYYVYRVFLKQSIIKSLISLMILSFNALKK